MTVTKPTLIDVAKSKAKRMLDVFRMAFLFGLLLSGTSCKEPKTVDLYKQLPDAYYLDETGALTEPPAQELFTSRLDLHQNLPKEAKVWLRYPLPADASFDRLLTRNCTNIEHYFQDQTEIFSNDGGTPLEDTSVFASLVSRERPSELFLQVGLSEKRGYAPVCNFLKLTTLNNAIWHYLVSDSPTLISGALICFVGIMGLVVNLSMFSWTLLFFGLHALFFGFYILSGLDVVARVFSDLTRFRVSGAFFILITFILFFEEFIGSKKQLARKFALFNVVLCVALQIILSADPAFYDSKIRPNLITIGIFNLIIVLLFVFEAASRQKAYARGFAFATAFLGFFVAIDMYNHFFAASSFLITPWIFLVVTCLTQMVLLKLNITEQSHAELVRIENAKKRNLDLQLEVERRTEALSLQTKELEGAHTVLEERVDILTKQKQSASEIAQEKDHLLMRITEIKKKLIPRIVARLQGLHDDPSPKDSAEIGILLDELVKIFSEATHSTPDEKMKVQETIDLLSANKRYQRTFKSSIGGAKLNLRIAETVETLLANIKSDPSRLIVVDDSFVERLPEIHELNPRATLVLFSEKDLASANDYQMKYPMLDQVLSLDLPKPILQKILLTHLMKLITQDVFGIEKYLMWGSAIKERPLDMRTQSADQWEGLRLDIEQAGLTAGLERKAIHLAENLLEIRRANLITSGKAEHHKLKQLRYGHDAHVLCLSVDLSGQILARQDIIKFFQQGEARHKLAAELFEDSHGIILNSNGNDKHELIVLLFQSSEEIPPAYYYTFISS